jgi:hypothetical protein
LRAATSDAGSAVVVPASVFVVTGPPRSEAGAQEAAASSRPQAIDLSANRTLFLFIGLTSLAHEPHELYRFATR